MESFKPEWHNEIIAPGKRPDKYQLDLWRANEIIFMEAGVKPENIHTTNICTMCNHEYLFPTVKLEMKEAIWVLFCALGDVFFKEMSWNT